MDFGVINQKTMKKKNSKSKEKAQNKLDEIDNKI